MRVPLPTPPPPYPRQVAERPELIEKIREINSGRVSADYVKQLASDFDVVALKTPKQNATVLVHRPKGALPTEKLPLLVWLHGGGGAKPQ